jgi:L-malate glycosyltransferase
MFMIAVESTGLQPAVESVPSASRAPRIRLLKFITTLGIGGTERQVTNLARMLDRTRFDPSFGCLRRWGHFLGELEQQGIPVTEYSFNRLYAPGAFRQQLRLAGDMRRGGVQIFHSYNFYGNVFGIPAARFARVPVVIASVRDTGMNITPARIYLHRQVCRLADCVLVNAEAIRQWLIGQGACAERIEVIRNGLDLSRFARPAGGADVRRELGLPAQAPLVLLLARLTPQKGIEVFLEAAAAVNRRFPETHFLIVGDLYTGTGKGTVERDGSYMESLRGLAARFGVGDRVIFTGFRSDVPELLSQATLSVLPSIEGEGLPNAIMESMAAGVPVVATRVGGSAEVVGEDGVAGLLVPPRDPAALGEAVCAVLADRELALRLGREARSRMQHHFSLERMVRQTENLYAGLLDKAMRRRRRHRNRS